MIKTFESFSLFKKKTSKSKVVGYKNNLQHAISKYNDLIKDNFPDYHYDPERIIWTFEYKGYDIKIYSERPEANNHFYFDINNTYMSFLPYENTDLVERIDHNIMIYENKLKIIEKSKKDHKELQEIDKEDLTMIFQDLVDLEVTNFHIDYTYYNRTEYFSSIEINFTYESKIQSSEDLKLVSNFYKYLSESIARIKSIYDQLNVTVIYDQEKKWKIVLTLNK